MSDEADVRWAPFTDAELARMPTPAVMRPSRPCDVLICPVCGDIQVYIDDPMPGRVTCGLTHPNVESKRHVATLAPLVMFAPPDEQD